MSPLDTMWNEKTNKKLKIYIIIYIIWSVACGSVQRFHNSPETPEFEQFTWIVFSILVNYLILIIVISNKLSLGKLEVFIYPFIFLKVTRNIFWVSFFSVCWIHALPRLLHKVNSKIKLCWPPSVEANVSNHRRWSIIRQLRRWRSNADVSTKPEKL